MLWEYNVVLEQLEILGDLPMTFTVSSEQYIKAAFVSSSEITRVLSTLEALDTHCFSRVDANCIDTLYSKIFAPPKENPFDVSFFRF